MKMVSSSLVAALSLALLFPRTSRAQAVEIGPPASAPAPESAFEPPIVEAPPPVPAPASDTQALTPPPAPPSFVPAAPRPAPMIEIVDDNVQHQFSITISPIHLLSKILELTGEYRLQDKLGIAGILGGGPAQITSTLKGVAIEAGTQFRYYAIGSFIHGMELGAELLMVYLSASGSSGASTVTGTGGGLAVGPFLGYKIAANVGFSFEIQLGAQYVFGFASASSGGNSSSRSLGQFIPLLNINLGWSF